MRALIVAACLVAAAQSAAQEDKKTDDDKPADPDTGESTIEEKTLGLLPNPWQKYGVKFAATYIGEVLGNPTGGLKKGAVYEGRLNLAVDLDFEKLVGIDKLTFHANMFQIHGEGLSRSNLQNFFVVSGIEALPSTRLYEAYFEKQWGDKKLSLKLGQLAADSEFFNIKYTDVFTNASMGWPAITSLALPSGGPSPPLAAVGARLLWNVTDQLSVLGAIFDGDQAGPGSGDPQERNRYGVNFRVNDPPLLLGQVQYAWNNRNRDPNLTGQFKVGGWRHFGSFGDQRFASNGVSLAAPTSSGEPRLLSGDIGAWAVFEQQIYRMPNSDDRGTAFSHACPARRLTAIWSMSMQMAASSSSGSAMHAPTTSSALPPDMRMSQNGPRRSTPIMPGSSIRAGRCEASRGCSRPSINTRSRMAGPFSRTFNTSSIPVAARRLRLVRCRDGHCAMPRFSDCARP